jgi:hypothetical protein
MASGRVLHLSAVRVGLGVAVVLMVPLLAMLITDEVVWSLGDFVVAGVFLAVIGIAVELALRRAGSRLLAFGIAVVGVVAAVVGEADDAPGLVLLGIVLVVTACALGVRSARKTG